MKGKNHTITDSKQQMLYHMFFSSSQYTEPDIVVIYRNTSEMSLNDGDENVSGTLSEDEYVSEEKENDHNQTQNKQPLQCGLPTTSERVLAFI